MDCPKCVGKLQEKTITAYEMYENKNLKGAGLSFDLVVNQCFACGGVWFDKGELNKYQRERFTSVDAPSLGKDLDAQLDIKKGKCPVCSIVMTRAPLEETPAVQADSCSKCGGIWLDSTEIDRVEKILAGGVKRVSNFLGSLLGLKK